MIALTLDKTEGFVQKMKRKEVDVRWEGWNLVFFEAHPKARKSVNGRFRNGSYGFETVVGPNDAGNWLVDYKLTRGRSARR